MKEYFEIEGVRYERGQVARLRAAGLIEQDGWSLGGGGVDGKGGNIFFYKWVK